MARVNRREVLSDGEVQVVHCINRCVRRAFLCGKDPITGADYEPRRDLIRQRMEFLASVMGVEVLGYSIMSNHIHIILRNRPDVVSEWSDEEIVQRWWKLCPARKEKDGSAKDITDLELTAMQGDTKKIAEWRLRLSSVSWFMRFLSEKVAREANKQDECTGRFWEGRFKAQLLLDEAAILTCMQYVDLNPVRAKLATTPEKSDFTSAQDRIVDLRAADSGSTAGQASSGTQGLLGARRPQVRGDGRGREPVPFSQPVDDRGDRMVEHGQRAGWIQPMALEPKRKRVRQKKSKRRCSNKGCLPLELGEYVSLLDWTGRQIRSGKRGSVPKELRPMFERLGISSELWVECVVRFEKWFRSSVGRPAKMEADAATRGNNRAISVRRSREMFG